MSSPEQANIPDDVRELSADEYRTRWLISHNALHDLLGRDPKLREQWNKYLAQLSKADEIAAQAA